MSLEPVRVLYFVSTLREAGPTNQLLSIVRYLDRERFAPLVLTMSPEGKSTMLPTFQRQGISVKSLGLSRLKGALLGSWAERIEEVVGEVAGTRSIIHSHGLRPDIVSARYLRGIRVATARNYPYHDYPMKFGPLLGRWMALQHLRAFERMPTVVACSATLAQALADHGIRTVVIRNGVDTMRFSPTTAGQRAESRRALRVPEEATVGVCVGSLVERKNPLSIVRAMREVGDPKMILFFVGSGNLEEQCRKEAKQDARIRFVGHVSDVGAYLRAADFLVSASRSEGMPNAALEALAAGLHLVLSNIGPHAELLELAPSRGEMFSLDRPAELRDALIRQANRRFQRSPSEVLSAFSAQEMSRQYQDLYSQLLQEVS